MGSATHGSETNIRRYGKGTRSSKKSVLMYSDYYEEKEDSSSVNLGRCISLTALNPGQVAPVLLEPRMAQLETLEAKMASIEVSLSTTPRRKKSGSIGGGSSGGGGVVVVGGGGAPLHRTSKDIAKELETLRNALRDKENVIQSLKGQLNCSMNNNNRLSANYLRGQNNNNNNQPLTDKEKRTAEDRLQKLRLDMDNKRMHIKNLKMALERLDITDNIDVRIKQAELEYQLGREELNLLSLLEESRNLQICLEDAEQSRARNDAATIYRCVSSAGHVTLHVVDLNYDPKSPRFAAGPRENVPGLFVEWATEDSGMAKGDRIVEVNGKVVVARSKDDMLRLLSVSPDPAQVVVMRCRSAPPLHPDQLQALCRELDGARQRAEDGDRARETLRSENVRLTHRISYLEEQVTDLLQRPRDEVTVTVAPVAPPPSPPTEVQVFQKGPQVTALVANLPGLDVGSSSPGESRHSLPTLKNKHNGGQSRNDSRSTKSLDFGSDCSSSGGVNLHHNHYRPEKHHSHHHHHHHTRSTNSLDVNVEPTRGQSRSRHHLSELHAAKSSYSLVDYNSEASSSLEPRKSHHRKYLDGVYNHSQQVEYHKLVLETKGLKLGSHHHRKSHDARSVKSLDFDSEPNNTGTHHRHHKSTDYGVEYQKPQRPTPPKKPLRLSLHRATSLQAVNATPPPTPPASIDILLNGSRKPTKRNYRGEAPLCPTIIQIGDLPQPPPRTPSRAESCQSAMRVGSHHSLSYRPSSSRPPNEKWC